jgi:hypothetical protein
MPHSMTLSVRRALAVLLLGVLGCSSDILLPNSPEARETIGALTKENWPSPSGPVGETLPTPLVVKVLSQSQQPVGGIQVVFELVDPAGGTVKPATTTTDASGVATTNWTFGTVPGSYLVKARLSGVGVTDTAGASDLIAEFHATAHPASPDTLSAMTALEQHGQRQVPVEDPPQVRVVDRFGNPVPGVAVAWEVIYGEGQITTPTVTDPEGKASVDWILGNRIGVHKLMAAIEGASGSPVVFRAHVFF